MFHLKDSIKQIIIILFLVLNINIITAQEDKSLFIGEWKVVSVKTIDYYYNSKTDSVNVTKEFKNSFIDSIRLNKALKLTKTLYSNCHFEFRDDQTYTRKTESASDINETYIIKPEKN